MNWLARELGDLLEKAKQTTESKGDGGREEWEQAAVSVVVVVRDTEEQQLQDSHPVASINA